MKKALILTLFLATVVAVSACVKKPAEQPEANRNTNTNQVVEVDTSNWQEFQSDLGFSFKMPKSFAFIGDCMAYIDLKSCDNLVAREKDSIDSLSYLNVYVESLGSQEFTKYVSDIYGMNRRAGSNLKQVNLDNSSAYQFIIESGLTSLGRSVAYNRETKVTILDRGNGSVYIITTPTGNDLFDEILKSFRFE